MTTRTYSSHPLTHRATPLWVPNRGPNPVPREWNESDKICTAITVYLPPHLPYLSSCWPEIELFPHPHSVLIYPPYVTSGMLLLRDLLPRGETERWQKMNNNRLLMIPHCQFVLLLLILNILPWLLPVGNTATPSGLEEGREVSKKGRPRRKKEHKDDTKKI